MTAANPLSQLSLAAKEAVQGVPAVLLAYQQEWVADRSPLKIADKGRRIGLTWAEAADDVLDAMAEVDGCNTFYISAALDMAREYIEACGMWARAFDYVASEIAEGVFDDGDDVDPAKRYIKTLEIVFPKSGRRIVALSSRPTNLRGKQGNIVLDEAAFGPDLAGLIKAAMAMLLWGNRVKLISTHNGVDNPFNQLIEEVKAGKRPGSLHHYPFRRAVADGLYRRVCLRRGIEWTQAGEDKWVADAYAFYGSDSDEELDAIPSASGGKYLSLALLAERMTVTAESGQCPIVRERWEDAFAYQHESVREFAIKGWLAEKVAPALARLKPLRRHTFSLDFARTGDLTVIGVQEEDEELVHRPRLIVELSNCPFTCQEQILWFIVDALPRFRGGAMDATGNGASLAEKTAQRYGTEMVEQVKLSQAFYALHMPKLKAALQDGTLRDLPRDEATRDDLRAIEVVKGIPMVPHVNTASAAAKAAAAEGGQKLKRHGDSAIMFFLGEYAWHREAGEIAWTPAPNPETLDDRSPNYYGSGQTGAMRWRPAEDDYAVAADAFEKGAP